MGHYKVIFLGLAVAGPEEESQLLKGLQRKFKLSPQKAESLLQRVPIVIKKGTSKEEMEKYVRAFEEIGGKVRIEEEEGPLPERPEVHPGPSQGSRQPRAEEASETRQAPGADKKPYTGRMITCPQCGFEQPETDDCIKCGIIISKYRREQETARAVRSQVREISSEERPAWESGEGFISAFFKTTKEVLFSPAQFYTKVANDTGYWPSLLYGVICYIIGAGVNILWASYFWYTVSPYLPRIPFFGNLSLPSLASKMISLPFVGAFLILFYSCLVHVCLMIVGGNKNGFRASFRVVSFAFSVDLFGIIPVIGFLIGKVYFLVLAIIGSREVHRISTGRAVLAVLLPLIFLAGLGVLAAIFLPLLIGTTRFWGGVGV